MTIQHLYPTTRPSLDLNFARQKRLDPRVTFTRGSTATYVGSDGLIKTAASNEARFDHDPETGESLGLLVEESRTNHIQYSQQLHLKGTTNAITQQDAAVSPDGTSTATLLTETTASGYHSLSLIGTTTFSANATLTVKAYLKNAGARYVALVISDGNVFIYGKLFDLQLGTVGADFLTAPVSASIKSLPNGWYECVVTATVTGYSTANSAIFLSRTQQFSYTGDGVSGAYVWGAQLEAGSFPTSYIPTTSSTVTRSADVASMTGTNFSSWYNQSEGTWFGEVKKAYPTTQRLLEVGDSATNNYSVSIRPGPTATFFARTASSASSVNHTYPAKFAVADSVTDIRGCVNGTLANLVSNGSSPTDNKLVIGGVMTATACTNAIARIAYYPTRLTDAQLQALTL